MSGTGNNHPERSDLNPGRQATIDFPYLQILIFNMCISFGISIEVRKLLRGHEEELSKEGR